MKDYFGMAFLLLFIAIIIVKLFSLKKLGIEAFEFGRKDKKDFFILPFVVFYFYLIVANAFKLPTIPFQQLFQLESAYWLGIVLCILAIIFFIWTIISFKNSFRVGLIENGAQGLITNGAFSISRNPIYVSLALMLIGEFLIFPSWILLLYLFLGPITFHRQILKEEKFLSLQFGEQYENYKLKVRPYL